MQKICHYIDFNIANMQKICKKYAKNMLNMQQKYAINMQLICRICISLCICIFCIYMHSPLCWWQASAYPGQFSSNADSEHVTRMCRASPEAMTANDTGCAIDTLFKPISSGILTMQFESSGFFEAKTVDVIQDNLNHHHSKSLQKNLMQFKFIQYQQGQQWWLRLAMETGIQKAIKGFDCKIKSRAPGAVLWHSLGPGLILNLPTWKFASEVSNSGRGPLFVLEIRW